jgi:hypothetical protein
VRACVSTCELTGLKDDRHVGGVEEFDGVFSLLSSVLGISDREIHTPSYKVRREERRGEKRRKGIREG